MTTPETPAGTGLVGGLGGGGLVQLGLLVLAGIVVLLVLAVAVVMVNRHVSARREQELRRDLHEQRRDIERREQRLAEREERLDAAWADLERRTADLGAAEDVHRAELERVAGLTAEAARAELVEAVEHEARLHAGVLARDIEAEARAEAESRARQVLATVVQRLASEQTAESTVTAVTLASDDLKGRIIGREGRNIRAFEQVTGVNLVIDDTPGTVLLSCFDPVRRETARLTLEALLEDGRVHPRRIEELYERCGEEIDARCRQAAADACLAVGITDLHPELVRMLGRLHHRTSYGQNVLAHLVESAHAAGLLADEIGVDRAPCVRAAFLHDIGKALTHEAEGSHARVGADLARRYGESPDVVHAIEAHHGEVEPQTVEAVLTQAADAISGGRPGARRESLESYLQRLHRLEDIALARPGVDRVYAMQAGRDVRVMVLPEVVDDIGAQMLARDLAKQYEQELTYPGQITVTVIRESRASEVAR